MIEVGKKYRVAIIDKDWSGHIPHLDDFLNKVVTVSRTEDDWAEFEEDPEKWAFLKTWLEEVIEQEPQSSVDTDDQFKDQFAQPVIQKKELSGEDIADIVEKKVRVFDTGSQRDNDDAKPLVNHMDPYVRLRFGYQLKAGALKYNKNNWRLGQDTETALESLHRHLAWYEKNINDGKPQDEDHLSAIVFNVMLMMKNEEKAGIAVDEYFGKLK